MAQADEHPCVVAFVMMTVAPGREREVREGLKEHQEVRDVIALFGQYDFCATVESEDMSELMLTVNNKIGRTNGVLRTTTFIGQKV